MSLDELREWVISLRYAKVCNGLTVLAESDKFNVAAIQLILVDNMVTVTTAKMAFKLDDPDITKEYILERLADEFAAQWRAVFVKAANPDQYVADGSPVMLVEEISGERVVRI